MKTTISFIKLLLWSFIFSIFVFLIFYILHTFFPETIQAYKDISPNNKENILTTKAWRFFLDACIIAPLVEESVFRLNLSKKIKNHYIAVGVAFVFILLTVLNSNYYNGYLFVLYSFLVFILYRLTKDNYPIKTMLVISSIAFGLIHYDNLDPNTILNPISYLIYTLPFMVLGYFFGIIRIKHGIGLAILAHFLKNCIAFIVVLN